ncbi:acyl CoA:acetate/3-ketoacid CoA transferase [Cloacibacillus evryensis]|uniref:acyl CoA:acetate/3-ketoacid CoA transferase n=1 Tax=Cloacibacillus evryensis TaxID=508460 RepID=UPI0004BAB032|nr:CoA-transferase [Cloacibacillus evryensis]MCQ4764142.1 3-oxoacid CoA-transferase [Cloacibacillus evryensis]
MAYVGFVPKISAEEAALYVKDNDVVAFCGAGGGITEASVLIDALAERYKKTSRPKYLTFWHSTGLGDRADKGMSPLAQKGLVKRVIGGHWGQSPRLADMADRNEIEAYNLPMGVMTSLVRAAAAGQPGILTHVGLGTFLDPRNQGGKLNDVTKEDLITLTKVEGKEFLLYKSVSPNVAFIRGTTADTEGYITMEDEITFVDNLAVAMATHNNGGKVICQVQKVVKAGSLHPKDVRIPGYLVDALVVVPDQPQLYNAPLNRFMSGDYVEDFAADSFKIPLSERKVIARRALMEITAGDIGNVGVGIADGIGVVAREEGVSDQFTLTVETGPIGGVSAQGIYFGASINMKAVIDMPSQFDFYDGGGLDICFLSFAEVDKHGNVNVHKFNGRAMGTGGFIDICQNAKKVVFCGTLTAGGLKVELNDGIVHIAKEGRFVKFVDYLPEITFNAANAMKNGRQVIYITERCVFHLVDEGIELIEIAPGVDMEKDIFPYIGFKPIVSKNLRTMDERLFKDKLMSVKLKTRY